MSERYYRECDCPPLVMRCAHFGGGWLLLLELVGTYGVVGIRPFQRTSVYRNRDDAEAAFDDAERHLIQGAETP